MARFTEPFKEHLNMGVINPIRVDVVIPATIGKRQKVDAMTGLFLCQHTADPMSFTRSDTFIALAALGGFSFALEFGFNGQWSSTHLKVVPSQL